MTVPEAVRAEPLGLPGGATYRFRHREPRDFPAAPGGADDR
ncbi:hypothetical protein ACLQ2R_16415 [Streptosporangium sp. DT93]